MNSLRYIISKQFIKFCVVGSLAALINFGFYLSLTELGLWYVLSSVVGFIVSAIFNFIVNKFWTFENSDSGSDAVVQLVKFFIVMISGLLIHTILLYLITDWVNIDYRISWVIATGLVTLWNYTFNRLWTFRVTNIS